MNKLFKSSEEVVSMFLGLVIVLVVVGLIFNYFQKKRGSISLSGVTDNSRLELAGKEDKDSKVTLQDKETYVVKKGDNLWKIAEKNYGTGYEWVKIAKENKLSTVGMLAVGQVLVMPKKSEVPVVTSQIQKVKPVVESSSYTVVKGDSLWKIAVSKYSDGYQWMRIYAANKNKLNNPGKLEIGMVLTLPERK